MTPSLLGLDHDRPKVLRDGFPGSQPLSRAADWPMRKVAKTYVTFATNGLGEIAALSGVFGRHARAPALARVRGARSTARNSRLFYLRLVFVSRAELTQC